jgi:hypothetical protein
MITPENNNLDQDNLNQDELNQNDVNQDGHREDRADRKTIYKETADPINEDKPDNGDSSSASETGRTDFINRPQRSNTPLGSGHEPGTMPGGNF